jgi:hypothetical protein
MDSVSTSSERKGASSSTVADSLSRGTAREFTRSEDGTSCEGQVAKAEKLLLKDAKVRLYASTDHVADFLARVKDRAKPITNEQIGGRSVICCHLMNLAYFYGKRSQWDPTARAFTGGTGDPAWLTRDYRGPWSV